MRIIPFFSPRLSALFPGLALLSALCASPASRAASPSANDGFNPNPNGIVDTVAVQADGRTLLGGNFNQLRPNGMSASFNDIARINVDGTPDFSFNPNANGNVNVIAVQPNAQIIVGGQFTSFQPNGGAAVARNYLARLNSDGTVDASFNPNPNGIVFATLTLPNGQILIGGTFSSLQPNGSGSVIAQANLARLNSDGSVDTTFKPSVPGAVTTLAVQPNGQVIIGGGFETFLAGGTGTADLTQPNFIARINTDGTTDTSFYPNPNGNVTSIIVLPNGQILFGGSFSTIQPNGATASSIVLNLARVNADGSDDTTFGVNPPGSVNALVLQPNGQVLIGGTFTPFVIRMNADGTIDATYAPNPNQAVNAIALQPDGSAILGGIFTAILANQGGPLVTQNFVARVSPTGVTDVSLDPGQFGSVSASVIQSDGKIVIAGAIITVGGETRANIARLNADGSLDQSFNPNLNGRVYSLLLDSTGKILIGGTFTSVDGFPRNYMARLNTDGTLDGPFNPNPNGSVSTIAFEGSQILIGGAFTSLEPNGTTVVSTRSYMARINSDGSIDPLFFPSMNAPVYALLVQPNGEIIAGGSFTQVTPPNSSTAYSRDFLARFNPDGTLDPSSFNPNANGAVYAMALQSDGKVVIGGDFTNLDPYLTLLPPTTPGYQRNYVARLNTDGTLDMGFDPESNGTVLCLSVLANGQILVGGNFSLFYPNLSPAGVVRNNLALLNTDGTVASGFDPEPNGTVNVAIPDGSSQFLITGGFTQLQPGLQGTPVPAAHVAVLTASGSPTSFSAGGTGPSPLAINSVAVQSDGRFLAGGTFTSYQGGGNNLVRFLEDGVADITFNANPDGAVNSILILPNGEVGPQPAVYGVWLNSNGTVRSALSAGANGSITTAIPLASGQLLVAGSFTGLGAYPDIARINADGTVDASFTPPTMTGPIYALAQQSDGKILIGGDFTGIDAPTTTTSTTTATATTTTNNFLIRLNTDGSLDTTFNPSPDAEVNSLQLMSNGQILVGGSFTQISANSRQFIARINADGSIDGTFNPNANGTVNTIYLMSNGQMLLGGFFTAFQPNGKGSTLTQTNLARINANGTLDTTFTTSPNAAVYTIAGQADGQILIGGYFTSIQSGTTTTSAGYIARLSASGVPDPSFYLYPNGSVSAIAVEPSGQIIIGGNFTGIQQTSGGASVERNFAARLNSNGSLDLTFDPDLNATVSVALPMADNSVFLGGAFTTIEPGASLIVGGSFTNIGGATSPNLARLNSDGSLDGTFTSVPNGTVNALANEGTQTLVGGTFTTVMGLSRSNLARLNSDGTVDQAFNPGANGAVSAFAADASQILVGGSFTTIAGQAQAYLARLNADGSADTSFAPVFNGSVNALAVQANGQILVAGTFTAVSGQTVPYLARLNSNGSVDTTYQPAPNQPVTSLLLLSDGTLLAGGTFTTTAGAAVPYVARYYSSGLIDTSFEPAPNNSVNALAVSGTKVIIGGTFSMVGNLPRYGLARLPITLLPTLAANVQIVGAAGSPFSYSTSPIYSLGTYSATGLPPGLSINSSTGVISGTPTQSGSYPVQVSSTNSDGSSTSSILITVTPQGGSGFQPVATSPANRLINVSSRATLSGFNAVITGFVISGSAPKSVLLCAVGPGLAGFGIPNAMANTELLLYAGSPPSVMAQNIGWGTSATPAATFTSTFNAVGATPFVVGSLDSAIITSLPPGAYTAVVRDPTGVGGTVLAEVFDTSPTPLTDSSHLVNVSARGYVSPGTGALIAGFVIDGSSAKSILIRGIGPALASSGVSDQIQDPVLSIYDASGNLIAQNLSWDTQVITGPDQASIGAADITSAEASVAAAALPAGSNDTALIVTVPPGAYTAVVTSASNATGEALAEVYELP